MNTLPANLASCGVRNEKCAQEWLGRGLSDVTSCWGAAGLAWARVTGKTDARGKGWLRVRQGPLQIASGCRSKYGIKEVRDLASVLIHLNAPTIYRSRSKLRAW